MGKLTDYAEPTFKGPIAVTGVATGKPYEVYWHAVGCWTWRQADGPQRGYGPGLGRSTSHHRTPDAATADLQVTDQIAAAGGEPLSRAEYEAACARHGLAPWPDGPTREGRAVDSYAVAYMECNYPDYSVPEVIADRLARRRLRAIEADRAASPPPTDQELARIDLVEQAVRLEERAQDAEDNDRLKGPTGAWALQAKAREIRERVAAQDKVGG